MVWETGREGSALSRLDGMTFDVSTADGAAGCGHGAARGDGVRAPLRGHCPPIRAGWWTLLTGTHKGAGVQLQNVRVRR